MDGKVTTSVGHADVVRDVSFRPRLRPALGGASRKGLSETDEV